MIKKWQIKRGGKLPLATESLAAAKISTKMFLHVKKITKSSLTIQNQVQRSNSGNRIRFVQSFVSIF